MLDSVFPLRRNHQRHTVGQRPVLKLEERGEGLVDGGAAGSLEAFTVDSRTSVLGETGLDAQRILDYVDIESQMEPGVAEVIEVHGVPVDGIGMMDCLDIVEDAGIGNSVSVTEFDKDVSVMALVEVPLNGDFVEQLLLLEGIAEFQPCRNVAVRCEIIERFDVETVYDSLVGGIAEIERIEDRTDAYLPFLLATDIGLNLVQDIVTDDVPHYVLGPVAFLVSVGCSRSVGAGLRVPLVVVLLYPFLLIGKRYGAHPVHESAVVAILDGIGHFDLLAVHRDEMDLNFVAHERELCLYIAVQGHHGDAVVAHRAMEHRPYHVVFAFERELRDAACGIVDDGITTADELGVAVAGAYADV